MAEATIMKGLSSLVQFKSSLFRFGLPICCYWMEWRCYVACLVTFGMFGDLLIVMTDVELTSI